MRANFVISGVAAGIRRNLSMTVALILSTAIALAFVGAARLANTEIAKFKHVYEGKINVSIYLCSASEAGKGNCKHKTTPAETAALQARLSADPRVALVELRQRTRPVQPGQAVRGPAGRAVPEGRRPAGVVHGEAQRPQARLQRLRGSSTPP